MSGKNHLEGDVLGGVDAYRALFNSMLNGLAYCRIIYDDDEPVDFIYLEINTAFERQTGLTGVVGKLASEVIPGIRETDSDLIRLYGRVAKTGRAEIFEHFVVALQMWFSVSVFSPKPDYFVAAFDVITERKLAEASLNKALAEAERFRLALDHVPAYIYMKDRQHRYIYANRITLKLFGCNAQELVGCDDNRFFPPATVKRLREVDDRVLSGATSAEEIDVDHSETGRRVYWEVKAPIYESGEQKDVWGLVGISTDITEHKELEAKLERQANTDFLTELPNRSHFFEVAEKEFSRARRYDTPLSIAMIDLDNFKTINDTYGHEVGDRVLKEFASVCLNTLREPDVIGRIGGEEFAVIFPETGVSHAMEVAERLRQAIGETRLPMKHGLPVQFTASIGVASLIDSDINIDVFLNRADLALYDAKKSGRNLTCEAKE